MNLFPSFFLPFNAKNKLSFLIDLESIDKPLKFTDKGLLKILFSINLF